MNSEDTDPAPAGAAARLCASYSNFRAVAVYVRSDASRSSSSLAARKSTVVRSYFHAPSARTRVAGLGVGSHVELNVGSVLNGVVVLAASQRGTDARQRKILTARALIVREVTVPGRPGVAAEPIQDGEAQVLRAWIGRQNREHGDVLAAGQIPTQVRHRVLDLDFVAPTSRTGAGSPSGQIPSGRHDGKHRGHHDRGDTDADGKSSLMGYSCAAQARDHPGCPPLG